LLRNCQLFDVYQGKGIPEGYRSLAVALSFSDPEKTLRDTDADAAIGRILEGLATLNCRLRDAQ
jgi:phenylalanyl-tRNA synthetase beta chain